MKEYLKLFIDEEYPNFIDKYLKTQTLERIKYVSQFCGCDYTSLYNPLFYYSRYDHSVVIAHMTYHFTHNKKATIAALLHDVGTPCFAHTIDYVFGDYLNQESSEKKIVDIIKQDQELLKFLTEDKISLQDLEDLSSYPILENNSPQLCTDRLDGVFHTCYIWLHTHSLQDVKEIYNDITILKNEDDKPELGFRTKKGAEKFAQMVLVYAKELQKNKDKYVMHYVAELVKKSVEKNLITLEDLYKKKEKEFITIFSTHFLSWHAFCKAKKLKGSNKKPNYFYVSLNVKKRNVVPLVKDKENVSRIVNVSNIAKNIYKEIENYNDYLYGFVEEIKEV